MPGRQVQSNLLDENLFARSGEDYLMLKNDRTEEERRRVARIVKTLLRVIFLIKTDLFSFKICLGHQYLSADEHLVDTLLSTLETDRNHVILITAYDYYVPIILIRNT